MKSEAFWTPIIASSQFDEKPELYSQSKVRPVKNQLYSPNARNYVREQINVRPIKNELKASKPALSNGLSVGSH